MSILCTRGRRAPQIDLLGLFQLEEIAALNTEQYGLTDPSATFNINGILWTPLRAPADTSPQLWPLECVTRHLREVSFGRIVREYVHP